MFFSGEKQRNESLPSRSGQKFGNTFQLFQLFLLAFTLFKKTFINVQSDNISILMYFLLLVSMNVYIYYKTDILKLNVISINVI